ncbi:MAG: ribosome recycling factor [Verrucomicrobiales bacterium]
MDEAVFLKETEDHMKKSEEYMIHEFAAVRTGKASPALVESIDVHVASYGSSMKMKQLAMITAPEPRLLLIQPFDPSTTQDIERGIRESKLGINPSVDGKSIRLPIPELSEERRRDLVKMCKGMAEDARVRIRGHRRDALDATKKAQKAGEITEDDLHRYEKEVQALTDKYVKDIDAHMGKKEEEIMKV